MMNCKDCIHYNICQDEYKDKLVCSEYKNKADYVEVKHGKWEVKWHNSVSGRGRERHYATFRCSECKKWNGTHRQNYCPSCGAKMDGGKK